MRLALPLLALAASGCVPAALRGPTARDLPDLRELAADFAELPVGEFRVYNNVWGREGGPGDQRIFTARDTTGKRVFGWSWRWPPLTRVGGYPEVMFGPNPWLPSRTARLPRPVGRAPLPVRYSVRLASTGVHNLAFDLWIVRGPAPTTSNIAAEVMIWLANRGMRPLGEVRARPVLGGVRYALWVADGVSLGQPQGSRRYIAFVAEEERLSGTVDLGAFLGHLIEAGLLDPDLTLAGVEFGTEIVGGAGAITVDDYAVDGVAVE